MPQKPPSLPHSTDSKQTVPERTAQFELSRLGKGVLIVSTLIAIGGGLVMRTAQDDSAFTIGTITGRLFALVCIPYFVGWLGWRLSGKRKGTGNLGLIVIGLLFIVANGMALLRTLVAMPPPRPEEVKEVVEIEGIKQGLQGAYFEGDLTDSEVIAAMNKIIGVLEDTRVRPGSDDEILVEESVSLLKGLRQALLEYAQVSVKFQDEVFLDPAEFKSVKHIAYMQAVVTETDRKIVNLISIYENMRGDLMEHLQRRGISKVKAEEAVKRMNLGRLGNMANIYQLEHVYLLEIEKLFKLMAKNWTRWEYSPEDETTYFDDDSTLEKYNVLIDKLVTLEEQIQEARDEHVRNW